MPKQKLNRVIRPATAEERQRHRELRQKIQTEYPPATASSPTESPPGLPSQIRAARVAKGLTWYAVAKLAGIPNSNTVRDIECGRDAQLSNVEAVARVLGMQLELVGSRPN